MVCQAQVVLSVMTWIALLDNSRVKASDRCGFQNWRCGDICIHQSKSCYCGGVKIQLLDKKWCCSCTGLGVLENPGDGNLDGLGWSHGGNCSSGKVLHLSQPCAGMCNDNRKDILQDFRSYIPCPPVTKINSVSQCIQQSEKSDNLFTCLNRADENPGGEDELREECDQAYLEKKLFTKDQTFICPNPYLVYNVTLPDGQTKKLFTNRAIRCNADPECWGGEDEKGCNVVEAIAQYVIRKLQ